MATQYSHNKIQNMIEHKNVLISIEPLNSQGVYTTKVLFKGIEYNFNITVEDRRIPVAFGDKHLFAAIGEEIDCYTNILKAVRLRHLQRDLSLPADLYTLEHIC